jgi:hypothetical protein
MGRVVMSYFCFLLPVTWHEEFAGPPPSDPPEAGNEREAVVERVTVDIQRKEARGGRERPYLQQLQYEQIHPPQTK